MPEQVDVTLFFTDIESSTQHWDSDPSAMGEAVRIHDDLVSAAVAECGGRPVKSTGDGLFATFDSVDAAVLAALQAQRELESRDWATTRPVRVRMGIHRGPAEPRGDDWFGREVSLAARVADAGHGGYVLLSAEAAASASTDCVDLGLHLLSGIADPQRLFAVRRPHPHGRLLRALTVERTNLPSELDDFVGRGDECDRLERLISLHQLVTITGPGGVGKTRLALHVASGMSTTFPDGVWLADLASTRSRAEFYRVAAEAVGLDVSPGRPLDRQLEDHLRPMQCLVVLDNCESVIDEIAEAVERIMSEAPGVRILATSRVLLDVAGETLVRLGDLGLPPDDAGPQSVLNSGAGALFVARAAQARPELTIGLEQAPLLATICRQVDGLPLGIELAAAALRFLSLDELPGHLDRAGGQLKGGRRRRRSRHSSIDAVIRASYDLLGSEEQEVFDQLAVFAGSFSASAVASVQEIDEPEAADLLSELIDHSMVVRVDRDQGTRYRLLETLRRFGVEQLESRGELDAMRDRHLGWALTLVGDLEASMRTQEQDAALQRVRPDHDNLRAARSWADQIDDHRTALRITASAPIDPESDRDRLLRELLDLAVDVPDDLVARAMYTCAAAALERGDWMALDDFAGQSRSLFEGIGNHSEATYARYLSAFAAWGGNDDPQVGEELTSILEAFEDLDDRMGCAYLAWMLAQWLLDHEPADPRISALTERSTQLFEAVGAAFGLAHAEEGLAYVRHRAGDLRGAFEAALRALGAFREMGNVGCVAHALDAIGVLAAGSGRDREAAEMLGAASGLRVSAGAQMRPWEQGRHETCVRELRARLDEPTWDSSFGAGEGLTLDLAVERARELEGMVVGHAGRVDEEPSTRR